MKYFGEFLVERQLITTELLAKALVTQVKALPSVPEVIFEGHLVTHEQLLAAFKIQNQDKSGFIEAATKLKIWNQALVGEVEKRLQAVRTPLGEVLVNLKALTIEQMTRALDEFLGERHESASTKVDIITVELKSELIDVLGAGSTLDRTKLERGIEKLENLRVSCEALTAPVIKELIDQCTDLITYVVKRKLDQMGQESTKKFQTLSQMGIELMWGLKDAAAQGADERAALKSLNLSETYQKFCDGCEVLKFDIETLDLEV